MSNMNVNIAPAAFERYVQGKITERIEHMREQRGLSVRGLAGMMSMNYSNLSHRLRGRVAWSVADVLLIKRLFRVDLLEGLENGPDHG